MVNVEVVQAWARVARSQTLELPDGSTVATALASIAAPDADIAGYSVFGVRVTETTVLRDGDRLELLRALQIDPKDARRRRASKPDTR